MSQPPLLSQNSSTYVHFHSDLNVAWSNEVAYFRFQQWCFPHIYSCKILRGILSFHQYLFALVWNCVLSSIQGMHTANHGQWNGVWEHVSHLVDDWRNQHRGHVAWNACQYQPNIFPCLCYQLLQVLTCDVLQAQWTHSVRSCPWSWVAKLDRYCLDLWAGVLKEPKCWTLRGKKLYKRSLWVMHTFCLLLMEPCLSPLDQVQEALRGDLSYGIWDVCIQVGLCHHMWSSTWKILRDFWKLKSRGVVRFCIQASNQIYYCTAWFRQNAGSPTYKHPARSSGPQYNYPGTAWRSRPYAATMWPENFGRWLTVVSKTT